MAPRAPAAAVVGAEVWLAYQEVIAADRQRERRERQLGEPFGNVENPMGGVAALDQPMLARRGHQKRERDDEERQGHEGRQVRGARHQGEALLEDALELEAEQHLGAKHLHAQLVQGDMDGLFEFRHRAADPTEIARPTVSGRRVFGHAAS